MILVGVHEGRHSMLLLSLRRVSACGATGHREQIRETLTIVGNLVITIIIVLLVILNFSREGICDKHLLFLVLGARSALPTALYTILLDH